MEKIISLEETKIPDSASWKQLDKIETFNAEVIREQILYTFLKRRFVKIESNLADLANIS